MTEEKHCRTCTFPMLPQKPASPLWQRISSGRSRMRTLCGGMSSRTLDTSRLRSFSPLRKQALPSFSKWQHQALFIAGTGQHPRSFSAMLPDHASMMLTQHSICACRWLQVCAGLVLHHHHLRAAALSALAAGQGPQVWRHATAAQHHLP